MTSLKLTLLALMISCAFSHRVVGS